MSVPETAVDENRFLAPGEHEIWLAWKGRCVEAIAIAHPVDELSNHLLSPTSLALDAGHTLAALVRCQGIHASP